MKKGRWPNFFGDGDHYNLRSNFILQSSSELQILLPFSDHNLKTLFPPFDLPFLVADFADFLLWYALFLSRYR